MKTLTLLRHAKSGWDDPVKRDFDRPLNKKGHNAALAVGRMAHETGLSPDRMIASPAVRVVQTLRSFAEGWQQTMEPMWDQRLYLASSATLLDIVQETPANISHLMLVGHNPGLEDLILDLVPDDGTSPLRDIVEVKFPTASLAQLVWDGDDWANIEPRTGVRLEKLTRPRDLDPKLGPDF